MGDSEFYRELGYDSYLAYLNSLNPIDIKQVSVNDIVWAMCDSLHWPAVVTDINEEGILKVWFVDNPYEPVERPATEVMAFHDIEEIREQAVKFHCVKAHDRIKDEAARYMAQKRDGHQVDPLQFFHFENSYFKKNVVNYPKSQKRCHSESVAEDNEIAQNDEEVDVEGHDMECSYFVECCDETEDYYSDDEYDSEGSYGSEDYESDGICEFEDYDGTIKYYYIDKACYKIEEYDGAESEGQCEEYDVEESEQYGGAKAEEYDEAKHVQAQEKYGMHPAKIQPDVKKMRLNPVTGDHNLCSSVALDTKSHLPLSSEDSYMKIIVNQVKNGKSVAVHLGALFLGKKRSFFYELYKNCMKTFTTQKLTNISYGPVDEVEALKSLIFYLVEAYKGVKKVVPQSFPLPECEPYFIAAVWLPESIVFSISQYNRMTLFDAYEVFIQSSALRPDYAKYVEEHRNASEVLLRGTSDSLDLDDGAGPSAPKQSLQFFDALQIVNDLMFVDKIDCKVYFTTMEEKMRKLQEDKDKTRQ